MLKSLIFLTEGDPQPQPRIRARNGKTHARVYTPTTADEWKGKVFRDTLDTARGSAFEPGEALKIEITFNIQRPASHLKKSGELRSMAPWNHAQRPDIDNLVKAVLDAMGDAKVFHNDSQVVSVWAVKNWVTERPGALIKLERIE